MLETTVAAHSNLKTRLRNGLKNEAERVSCGGVSISCGAVSALSNNNIEPLTATDPAGQRVDFGKTDASGNQTTVSLRPSGAETYRAVWQVLSVDSTRQTPIPSLVRVLGP
jgi:hypothetical protein